MNKLLLNFTKEFWNKHCVDIPQHLPWHFSVILLKRKAEKGLEHFEKFYGFDKLVNESYSVLWCLAWGFDSVFKIKEKVQQTWSWICITTLSYRSFMDHVENVLGFWTETCLNEKCGAPVVQLFPIY